VLIGNGPTWEGNIKMSLATRTIENISAVDRLGSIKAQIASLKVAEDALVAEIKAMGAGAHDGDDYRATVSDVAEGYSLDAKAAEAKLRELGVDGRWFAKHQKVRSAYTVVKVSARKS
jgi:hypothetical protein